MEPQRFNIGKYVYNASPNDGYYYISESFPPNRLDTDDSIKSYDHLLHQSLDKILCERCSSTSSSSEFKKFRLDPQHDTGWKSIIKPILEQEPALNRHFSTEEFGKLSLLWISVLAGYEKSAELLVRSGADVNELFGRHDPQVIDEKWTVLHVLLQMDPLLSPENERLIRLIADHGADLQARDYEDKTVLHYAIEERRVQITKMLLEKGADVNAADNEGMTPLLEAASRQEAEELLLSLMKHGADIFAKDHRGMNVLHHLTSSRPDNVRVVGMAKLFIEKGVSPLDEMIGNRSQPIHLAAMRGNDEFVKLFLDHGVHVNVQNEHGESPLYIATWFCSSTGNAVIETLLKRGANINLRALNGQTALHSACKTLSRRMSLPIEFPGLREEEIVNTMPLIKLLLSAGADVLAQDSDGNTPLALILSGRNGEPPVTRLLIEVLALKKARQPSIELMDESIIEQHPTLQNYYRDCFNEIDRMKSTKFIHTCTFFKLFLKSYCQIAALMRNPEFETKFKQYDLSGFPTYAEDIRGAFERAQDHFQSILKQENVINEAFYNILPHLVVEKVVHYIFDYSKNSQNM